MVVAALCLPFNYPFKHGSVGKFITICLFSHQLPGALTSRIFQFGNANPTQSSSDGPISYWSASPRMGQWWHPVTSSVLSGARDTVGRGEHPRCQTILRWWLGALGPPLLNLPQQCSYKIIWNKTFESWIKLMDVDSQRDNWTTRGALSQKNRLVFLSRAD